MPLEAVHHPALKLAASAAIGLLIPATAHPFAIALTAFVPVLWLLLQHRAWAYASSGAYYLSAIWPVIPVVHRFNGSFLTGFAIWVGAALLLAMPWLIFRPRISKQALWCGPAAMLVTIVPPLGVISVACPISAAGYLFPGMKTVGLLAALLVPGAIIWRPRPILSVVAAATLTANALHVSNPPAKPDWESANTLADNTPGAYGDYQRIQAMLDRAEGSKAKVIVFPEANIRCWTPTTLSFFNIRIAALRAQGKTIVTGALVPTKKGYRNVVEGFGAAAITLEQRIPVPLGMWKPFRSGGVEVKVYGDGIVRIQDRRVAILVCYEQLLAWPGLQTTPFRSDIVVGIGDDQSEGGTLIPTVRSAYLKAWARLWSVPMVEAISH
jgi:hypothetical protein